MIRLFHKRFCTQLTKSQAESQSEVIALIDSLQANKQFSNIDEAVKLLKLCQLHSLTEREPLSKVESLILSNYTTSSSKNLASLIGIFASLDYWSKSLNFISEKNFKATASKCSVSEFISIFNTFAKFKTATKGLKFSFSSFISSNIERFTLEELVKVAIQFPKVFSIEEGNTLELIYSKIKPEIDSLGASELSKLFLVLFGGEFADIFRKESEVFLSVLREKEGFSPNDTYLLITAATFSRISIATLPLDSLVASALPKLIPEELNTMLYMVLHRGNTDLFKVDVPLFAKNFLSLAELDLLEANPTETVMFLQSFSCIKNRLYFNDEIYPKAAKMQQEAVDLLIQNCSELDLADIADLLELDREEIFSLSAHPLLIETISKRAEELDNPFIKAKLDSISSKI